MSCGAQGSRSGLAYAAQVDFHTVPTDPTLINLPFSTHNLDMSKTTLEGTDIQADRMPRVYRHGVRTSAGDIVADFRKGDFDPFLESVMFSSWSTNTLKVGVTPKHFYIEDRLSDITQFRGFTGMSVNSMQMSIQSDQMITTTFSMVGKDFTISDTSIGTGYTPISTNEPMDGNVGSSSVAIGNVGNSSATTIITGLDFTIDNGQEAQHRLGSNVAKCLTYGRATITGTFTAFFEDADLINRFDNETLTEISVTVDDPSGSNPYTFLFPSCKLNGAPVPLENEQTRFFTIPFVALFDATENSNLTITRTP
jgi:hypothetical protein